MANIPPMVRPDTKSVVWMLVGLFVAPKVINKVRP